MATLPKLDLPRFKHTLTGLGKEVRYRPFTVKEQKILLLSKETKDSKEQVDAIKQVIELCTESTIKVDQLAFFDIEDLFLRIRAKSVSNLSEIMYRVKSTDKKIKITIDLDDVKVVTPEGHERKIMITDDIGIYMEYPSLDMLTGDERPSDDAMLRKCIGYAFTEDEVFYFKDFTDAEVEEWIESFDMPIMAKIKNFFDTMPRVRHEMEVNIGDGQTETLKFEGLEDFFS